MDVSHVRQRVQAIGDAADDPEVAHLCEDELLADVLKAIAAGSTDDHARALAGEAPRAQEIKFERWYS
ncbi:hypothetical protein [Streptomyces indicus]|uniref:Uncharacterized protein n=1 Tax=Streptomyces indicus TaxID=417292 RepID=A0A1G9ISL1_9ACTN|nr:hypothetical protein [Streptomyces indicus]SDL27933.1 hypothetical protein SAMN05421806_12534 [Streptomyces indicus]